MAINNTNFQLVSKLDDNIGAIFLNLPDGNSYDIAWFRFPKDHQIQDNVEAMNSMVPILRKRIRKSLC